MKKSPSGLSLDSFIRNVPQIVPDEGCLRCRVCCRFPDTEGVQTPAWAPVEAEWLGVAGKEWLRAFPGSPSLAPKLLPCGEGHRCPAFDPSTSRCAIHADRPLDCRLYPFVLARSPGGETVLAMDAKCPYIQERGSEPEVIRYTADLASYLDTPDAEEYVRGNPKIIGPFWPEFLSVAALPRLTAHAGTPPDRPHPALEPVRLEESSLISEALVVRPPGHSGSSLAALFGWSDVIRLWKGRIRGTLCLFSELAGGFFMPVPPLVRRLEPDLLAEAWRVLDQMNKGAGVSRIEGVCPEEAAAFREAGFTLIELEREYVYRRENLAGLSGDPYRSQRWAANRFRKSHAYRFRPFEQSDLLPCLQLYTRWAIDRQKEATESHVRSLVRDGLFFHRRLMISSGQLGLAGRVLESEGAVRGYTFGGPLSGDTFGVFLEIADRAFTGSAQAMFQDFCKEMDGYAWVNAMGDSGLEGLRRAKLSYRPSRYAATFSATRP